MEVSLEGFTIYDWMYFADAFKGTGIHNLNLPQHRAGIYVRNNETVATFIARMQNAGIKTINWDETLMTISRWKPIIQELKNQSFMGRVKTTCLPPMAVELLNSKKEEGSLMSGRIFSHSSSSTPSSSITKTETPTSTP